MSALNIVGDCNNKGIRWSRVNMQFGNRHVEGDLVFDSPARNWGGVAPSYSEAMQEREIWRTKEVLT